MRRTCRPLLVIVPLLFVASPAAAGPIGFELFTPLSSSVVGGSLRASTPLLLSSPNFVQKTIAANDLGPLNGGVKLGDNWDMLTFNENGPSAGRFLFSPYETGAAGVRRHDLSTGTSVSIVPEGAQGFVNGDASRWTPFGTYLTAEESWGTGSTKGRLFEVTNPLDAPGSVNFVARNVIPRVSHEGLVFDENNSLYFIDELDGGSIYRYVSTTPTTGSTFFTAGQTSVLKIGAGGNSEATGAGTWVPITDANGLALPGIPTVVIGGVTSVDGRAAADVPAVLGTGFGRPEDLEIQTLANGDQIIYFGTTTTHKVFSLNISNPTAPAVKLFASQSTVNSATGLAVGSGFQNPDNFAIDANGNIYFTEDVGSIANGGQGFDIWFGYDADRDGVAEAIGRWASLSTVGAEPTGLYFSPFDPNVAYLNVQHAGNDVDRTLQITAVPEPATWTLMALGLVGVAARLRKRA